MRRRGASDDGAPVGRRVVLGLVGLGAVGVVTGSTVGRVVDEAVAPLRSAGVGAFLPSSGGFTIYTVTSGYPAPPADYRVRVGGLVSRPLALSVADLRTLPPTRLTSTFQCVTGWSVADVHWEGVALVDVLDRAGIHRDATSVRFASFDGAYTESLTLAQARQSGAIVAYSMLGAPVSRQHGGPVRLYVPGMFGYKSIKWLASVEAVRDAPPGYWEQNGYPIDAWIDGHPPAARG